MAATLGVRAAWPLDPDLPKPPTIECPSLVDLGSHAEGEIVTGQAGSLDGVIELGPSIGTRPISIIPVTGRVVTAFPSVLVLPRMVGGQSEGPVKSSWLGGMDSLLSRLTR